MNKTLVAYLAEAGIEVIHGAHSGRSMAENASLDDETGIRLAVELGGAAFGDGTADAVIMPGGRWLTLGAVRALEERFGKPVITNHTAGLWSSLRAAGHPQPIFGWGRLLASLGDPAP